MLDTCADDLRAFADSRILITGGTGFIGSWLCESIRIANAALGTKIRFVACDRNLIFSGPFDAVIHLAPCDLEDIIDRAVEGVGQPILIASSGAVLHKPVSYLGGYATQKRSDEDAVRTHRNGKIARLYSFMAANLPKHLAAAQFLDMARSGGPIVVHSGGLSVRSYLWAGDLVAWLWGIFARGEPGVAYEVGGEEILSIAALAQRIGLAADVPVHLSGPHVAGETYVPDLTLARGLGLTASVSLDDAIRLSLDR